MLLQRREALATDEPYRQALIRAYWACYLIEHELQVYMPWSSQLVQQLSEDVDLPSAKATRASSSSSP